MSSNLAATTASATAGASSAPAWRHYPFFEAVAVKDAHDLESPPDIFKAAVEISTVASSSAGVLVADIHGSVHLLNQDFEPISSWVAHVGGRVTHMVERKGILVALGEEDNVRSPLIKIWDLTNLDSKTGAPVLLRSTKLLQSNKPHPVSTVALSASLAFLAVGLGDGTVLLFRHLDQSLATSSSLTSLPKARTVHESPAEPITGLGFKESAEDSPALSLFIVTTGHVFCLPVSGKTSSGSAVGGGGGVGAAVGAVGGVVGVGGGSGGGSAVVVDEIGCGLGCACMDWRARDMVVAKDEAIFFCGTEGRGACYAYEGHKSSVHPHLNYLVIVSPPFVPSASAASATVRNLVARTPGPIEGDVTKVTVFEPENKYVAYSGTFAPDVRAVFSQWGNLYILTTEGKLTCLQEKSTAERLDVLYRRSLYSLALSIAKTQSLDEANVADIHRQYGDHLYAKGEYDNAMQQYVQTIGHLQPSYVIRKFLDSQRIHNLVTYLQELHSLGLANSDHTTLLLNTYTKLKDVSRLDSFIKTESRRKENADDSDELPFDLETAIRVCRQAGYFEHASYLAKKYERHEDYLRIQIEDAGNYKDALMYLRKLGMDAAESNLARYGRAMLDSLPEETTQLLVDLCTSTGPLTEPEKPEDRPPSSAKQSHPSYLSYLALNRASTLPPRPSSAPSETATPPSPSIKTVKPETASRRDSLHDTITVSRPTTPPTSASATAPRSAMAGTAPVAASVQPSATTATPVVQPVKRLSPRVYFAHFVDHLEQFLVFLETVALRRWGQSVEDGEAEGGKDHRRELSFPGAGPVAGLDEEQERLDKVAVWNTLLELYLTLPGPAATKSRNEGETKEMKGSGTGEKKPLVKEELRKKALRVLTSDSIPYDHTHALILCSSHGYTEGLVLLWEKLGMYEDVLWFWMDRDKEGAPGASARVVERLKTYGEAHPHLYPLVLRFLTSTPELLSRHREDLKGILEYIDEGKIMPPLAVVRVLSRNGVTSVGLVKDWLMGRIRESNTELLNDYELITSYRAETAAKLKQVKELSDPDAPHVFHVTRCSSCSGQLDLPSVHFMCNHSYHQRCLAENENECPTCAREHGVIREIRKNNARLADQHDVFLSEVQEGGFEAVAAAFGRGLLNGSRLDDVS